MRNTNYKNVFFCLFVFKGEGELKADKLIADHSFNQKEDKKYF